MPARPSPPPPAPPATPSPRAVSRRARIVGVGLLALLLALVFLVPQLPSPPPSPDHPDTVLVDKVALVSPDFASGTNAWLHARQGFEAVLYIDAMPPAGPLRDWTTQTAIAWGVGKARQDRGLAIFVFRDARLARIEVGYGLEGRLPDAWVRHLLETRLVPPFAQGQYEAGIEATLDALQQRLEGDPAADSAQAPHGSAWLRTWADAWNHGARLVPAVMRHYRQSGTFERVGILAFALPLVLLAVPSVAAAVVSLQVLAKTPRWLRAVRERARARVAPATSATDVPELLLNAGPRGAPLIILAMLGAGAFVSLMFAALVVFVFSMAPDRLTRQGQYGGAGVTVTWPAPGPR